MTGKTPSHHGIKESVNEVSYPNETIKLLLERASCRTFSDKKIEPDVLEMILQAGVNAATGGNLQQFSIIKVENEETKKTLVSWGNQDLIEKAPVSLLFCIDLHRNKRWAELCMAPYTSERGFHEFWISFQDTMIAAQNICTAADAFGLGSVYLGTMMYFIPKLRELFALPKGVIPVVMVSMGYPANEKAKRKKLDRNVIVHNEKYNELPDQELLKAFDDKYPGVKVDITEDKLKIFKEVSRQVHGEEFAEKAVEHVKKQGYFNPAQRYFGLHYMANGCMQKNLGYIEILKMSGMDWFQNYDPDVQTVKVSDGLLMQYAGKYYNEEYGEFIDLIAENCELFYSDSQVMKQKLFAVGERSFIVMDGYGKIEFIQSETGFDIIWHTAGKSFSFIKK